jgi:hypothetical protein
MALSAVKLFLESVPKKGVGWSIGQLETQIFFGPKLHAAIGYNNKQLSPQTH